MVVRTYVERYIPFHFLQHIILVQKVQLRVQLKYVYMVISIHAVEAFSRYYVHSYMCMLNVLKVYVPVGPIFHTQSHMFMYS